MNAHTPVLKPYGMPKGMNPREWRQSVEKRLNDLLDRAMSLITALDLMEADYSDDEGTGDDEPSLGWGDRTGQSFLATAPNLPPGDVLDLELDNADDEDGHDAEPDQCDGETVTWENDHQSQAVLVSL